MLDKTFGALKYFRQINSNFTRKPLSDLILEIPEKGIKECVLEKAEHLAITVPERIPETYSKIEANKGDDEVVMSNCPIMGAVRLAVTDKYIKVKTSWKDTGVSKHIGNYAEEWIPTPLTAASTWDAVTTREKAFGLPFILDSVKTKLLSPVRKQSDIELDLESKFGHLSVAARWTNRAWISYDLHQTALLLGTMTLDLDSVEVFPFLFKTEGGCGGSPPWGNLCTLYSYLWRYHKGKSKKAVIGLMQEAVGIHDFTLKPSDAYLLTASHLVQANDKSWLDLTAKIQTLKKEGWTDTDISDLINDLKDDNLPPDLMAQGITLEPEDYTVGSAVSKLRAEGLIMTQLDVLVYKSSLERMTAVSGNTPMKYVLQKEEDEKKKHKEKGFKLLQSIVDADYDLHCITKNSLLRLPDSMNPDYFKIAGSYYRIRMDEFINFTSFFYTKSIRIFRTDVVRNYYELKNHRNFIYSLFPVGKFEVDNTDQTRLAARREDEENHRHIMEWFEHFRDRQYLWEHPLPTGLGTDDARIVHQAVQQLKNAQEYDSALFILISKDKELGLRLKQYLATYRCNLGQMSVIDYLFLCNNPDETGSIFMYNIVHENYKRIPNIVIEAAIRRMKLIGPNIGIFFLYDVPNIEKATVNLRRKGKFTFSNQMGGYFSAKNVMADRQRGQNPFVKSYENLRNDLKSESFVKTIRAPIKEISVII